MMKQGIPAISTFQETAGCRKSYVFSSVRIKGNPLSGSFDTPHQGGNQRQSHSRRASDEFVSAGSIPPSEPSDPSEFWTPDNLSRNRCSATGTSFCTTGNARSRAQIQRSGPRSALGTAGWFVL